MCGIYGFLGLNDPQLLKRMGKALEHRGPDENGIHIDNNINMGSDRLSIVGINNGRQPIYNEDKSIVVVANCEIYNYKTLKAELEKKGHEFTTETDTEVIVHMYEEYGKEVPKYLNGDFAFAIWDQNKKQLLLARDHFGINPVYYVHKDKIFYFASEIKALLEAQLPRELDLTGLYEYLTFAYTVDRHTLFKNIYAVLPSEYILVTDKGYSREKYWTVPNPTNELTEEAAITQVREAVTQGIKNRMMSDVPIGIFLSDGIDSNIVASVVTKHMDQQLNAYSIKMEGVDTERIDDSVKKFNLNHTYISLEKEHIYILPKIIKHLDCLTGDPTAVPNYLLSQEAHKKVKTVLTGEGADELFYGYDLFKRFTNSSYHPMHERAEKKYFRFLALFRDDFTHNEKQVLIKGYKRYDPYEHIYPYFENEMDSKDQLSRFLLGNYLPNSLLNRLNHMSLANSLEGRVPFLDIIMATKVITQVPHHLKLKEGTEKYILSKAFKNVLPLSFRNATKKPFSVPLEKIYGKELYRELLKVMEETGLFKELINKEFVEKIIKKNEHSHLYSRQLWSLLAFAHWYKIFILQSK